jgi:hypothetical protein
VKNVRKPAKAKIGQAAAALIDGGRFVSAKRRILLWSTSRFGLIDDAMS